MEKIQYRALKDIILNDLRIAWFNLDAVDFLNLVAEIKDFTDKAVTYTQK